MAVSIPDSRLGRALKAGIPVAFILLAAELIDGSWRIERSEHGLSLSWTSADEAGDQPAVRVLDCARGACHDVAFSLSLRTPQLVSDAAALAGAIGDMVWSDCREPRARFVVG